MPIFDRTLIPDDVFTPEALDHLDDLIEGLSGHLVDRIVIPDRDTGFRVPGMARALSQSYIRRCVELTDASADLCHSKHWLPAIVMARSLMETIAAFNHVADKLGQAVGGGDTQEIHDFIHAACFTTRLDHLIGEANNEAVTATNILTQIDRMTAERASIRDDYDHLCEYSHPNSFGTFMFFGQHGREDDTVSFNNEGWQPDEALFWVGAVCSMLSVAQGAVDEIERLAQQIAELEADCD